MALTEHYISSASTLLASLTAFLACLAACAGCSFAQPANEAPLNDQIDAMIGDARCSTDMVCLTIGIGAKACGGPSSYRAWSAEQTDAKALLALVARHHEARLREIARTGEQSNCAMVPVPGAFCERLPSVSTGRCELRQVVVHGGISLLH